MIMTTDTATDRHPEAAHRPRVSTGVVVSLVAVLGLLVGVGAGWLLFSSSSPFAPEEQAARAPSHSAAAVQDEATALLDAFWAAWVAGDTATVESLMTSDGAFVDIRDCAGATVADGGVAGCVTYHPAQFEPAVDPVILSDGPPYAAAQIVMANVAPKGTPGGDPDSEYFSGVNTLAIFVLDEEDGVLKIKEYRGL